MTLLVQSSRNVFLALSWTPLTDKGVRVLFECLEWVRKQSSTTNPTYSILGLSFSNSSKVLRVGVLTESLVCPGVHFRYDEPTVV